MRIVKSIRNLLRNTEQTSRKVVEIKENIDNQFAVTKDTLVELLQEVKRRSTIINGEFSRKTPIDHIFDQIHSEVQSEQDAAKFFDRVLQEVLTPQHRSVFWGDRLLTLDKSVGFLSEPDFRAAYDTIHGTHQYDQYSSPQSIAWRLNTLVWAARTGLALEGDFVECGIFKGDMSWIISQVVDFKSAGKQFYLYDTFNGMDDRYSSADDFPENPNFYNFANKHYRDPSLYPYVCNRFRDRPEIKVIKGVVPDILHEVSPAKIAFLHIDLNSPAPEVAALEILFPRVASGGIVVFDDYGWKQCRKQKDAEDEFMKKQGYKILELPTGQGMVVKR